MAPICGHWPGGATHAERREVRRICNADCVSGGYDPRRHGGGKRTGSGFLVARLDKVADLPHGFAKRRAIHHRPERTANWITTESVHVRVPSARRIAGAGNTHHL